MSDDLRPKTGSTAPENSSSGRSSSWPFSFFVGMALLLLVLVMAGFWQTYFTRLFLGHTTVEFGRLSFSWPIHLHAGVFVGWLVLFLSQTALVASDRTRTHMKVGGYGAMAGLIVFLVGVFITLQQVQARMSMEMLTWAESLPRSLVSWLEIAQFGTLLILGLLYRTSPETHKRYMLLASVAVAQAAAARLQPVLGPWDLEICFVVMIGPLFIYDLWTQERLHPATLIGTAVLLLHVALRVVIF